MQIFCVVMFAVLIVIIYVWNGVTDFRTAYIQSCVFLVVTNWFDGIVVDRLWVGRGKLWGIKGMEGVPYIKPWKLVLTKRTIAMVLYLSSSHLRQPVLSCCSASSENREV